MWDGERYSIMEERYLKYEETSSSFLFEHFTNLFKNILSYITLDPEFWYYKSYSPLLLYLNYQTLLDYKLSEGRDYRIVILEQCFANDI